MRLSIVILSIILSACTTSINRKTGGEYYLNKDPSSSYKRKLHGELIFVNGSRGAFFSWTNHMLFDHRTFTMARIGNDSVVLDYRAPGTPNDTILIQRNVITTRNSETFAFKEFTKASVNKVKRTTPSNILDTLRIK